MKTKRIITAVFIAISALCALIPAALAASGIEFTAEISAEDTWIPPGGTVDFTMALENCGIVDIDRFEIITPDAQLAGEYGSLPAGESASVNVPIIFDNAGEYPVELFVAGYHGSDSLTVHTNEIIITVSVEPEPTPTAEPETEGSDAPASSETITAEDADAPADAAADAAGVPASPDDIVIYVAIGVLGVLAVAVIITIIVIAAGRKRK